MMSTYSRDPHGQNGGNAIKCRLTEKGAKAGLRYQSVSPGSSEPKLERLEAHAILKVEPKGGGGRTAEFNLDQEGTTRYSYGIHWKAFKGAIAYTKISIT